jgi:hypothetical protein
VTQINPRAISLALLLWPFAGLDDVSNDQYRAARPDFISLLLDDYDVERRADLYAELEERLRGFDLDNCPRNRGMSAAFLARVNDAVLANKTRWEH